MAAGLNGLTASSLYIEYLLDYALSRGCDLTSTLVELGVTAEQLESPGARISLAVERVLYDRAITSTGDELFGLHMGEAIRPRFMGPLGYASMASATLGDAMTLMPSYQRVTTEFGVTSASLQGDRHRIRWVDAPEVRDVTHRRHRVENYFAACITFGRWITGSPENPAEIRFEHPAPAPVADYERVFRCPVVFSAGENSISLPRKVLSLRLRDADPEVHRVMSERVRRELSSYEARGNFLDQVRHAIREEISTGAPSVESVAERMAMRPWTLRRNLRVEGFDFTTLLDDVRKTLAAEWLSMTSRTVGDIALGLGYSEQSAFNRAFKRWFDLAPLEYRDRHSGS